MKKALIVFLVLIVILLVAKNIIIKIGVEQGVKIVTGLPLKIQSIKVGVFKTRLDIKGLQLFNPQGYKDRIMVDIPEVYVDYSILPLLKKKVYVSEVRFHLKEFNLVTNKEGKSNIDSLKALQQKTDKTQKDEKPAGKKKKPDINLQIDLMKLKVDKVVIKDYSKGDTPSVKEMNINIDETFKDITSPGALVGIIVFKTLMSTGLSSLPVDLSGVKGLTGDALKSTKELAGDVVQVTGDTIKKTTEGIQSIIRLPFGKKE